MSAKGLSSRAIIGEFFLALEALTGQSWMDAVSMLFTSDQESETYKWLGQVPAMREFIGGRHAKGFQENGITIPNKHFEATLEVFVEEMRRDKTGQVMLRVRELAGRIVSHWASLLSTLIVNGESTACYDGQFFFDTDHQEGDSPVQSNDISVDISTLPTTNHGTPTAPSVGEMQKAILLGIQQMYGFVDNEGEPYNETAQEFLVKVPTSLFEVALAATRNPMVDSGESNTITNVDEFRITVRSNPRLSAWTDKFAVFRTDGNMKPFIRQQETDVMLKAVAEGSELEFNENKHHYGVDTWRNVGYGFWQHSCLVTMI